MKKKTQYSAEINTYISRIRSGQTSIDAVLDFTDNQAEVAGILRRENIMPQVDFLKYVIKHHLTSTLFVQEMKDCLMGSAKEPFLGKIPQFLKLIKALKREYKHSDDLDKQVNQIFKTRLGDYEMMIEFCFRQNNPQALKEILDIKNHASTPVMHMMCENLHMISPNKQEEFYNLLTSYGRTILDIPHSKKQLCLFEISEGMMGKNSSENLLILVNLLDDKLFHNKNFLNTILELEHHLFPCGEDETNSSIKQTWRAFCSIVDKKKMSDVIQNKKTGKNIL